MHPSIYREFHLSLAPGPALVTPGDSEIFVRLQHSVTGEEGVFKLQGGPDSSPERGVEEQVRRLFPHSAAAAELRTLYGETRHRLRAGWDNGFGDRIYRGVGHIRGSNGGRFWAELIPTLPPILYTTMNARAVEWLERLGPEVELRTIIKTVHDAWLTVLKEARSITTHVTGLQRLALDINGWPTELMLNMAIIDYSRLKEKALFARLALGYLSDEDWAAILASLLEPAPAPAGPTTTTK